MPRTTLNIDKSVLDEIKQRARRQGVPLGDLVTSLLCRALENEPPPDKPTRFKWHSRDLGPSTVDMSDWSAFMQRLYAEDDVRRGNRS